MVGRQRKPDPWRKMALTVLDRLDVKQRPFESDAMMIRWCRASVDGADNPDLMVGRGPAAWQDSCAGTRSVQT